MAGKEFNTVLKLLGKVDPSLPAAFTKVQTMAGRVSRQSMAAIGNAAKAAAKATAVGMGVAAAAVGVVSGKGIMLASDLIEVQNVVDTTFTQNADKINQWSKTALDAFGLSELQAKQFNGTMGAMLKSSGLAGNQIVTMSENLSGLAGDMASFYNLPIEEAFDKVKSGISGETEPLKSLGVNMSVANMQAYALSQGITTSWNSMDQASQTALRYSYLMSVTKDAQGDFSKTAGTFANQLRLVKTRFDQLTANAMKPLLPVLNQGLQSVNKLMQGFEQSGRLKAFQDRLTGIAGAAGKVISGGAGILKDLLLGNFQSAGSKSVNLMQQLGIPEDQIQRVSKIILAITDTLGKISPRIANLAAQTRPFLLEVEDILPGIIRFSGDVLNNVAGIAGFIMQSWPAIGPVIMGAAVAMSSFYVITKATMIIGVLSGLMEKATILWGLYREGVSLAEVAQLAFNGTLLASPFTWVAVGIGVLIAAGIALYKNWDTVSAFLSKTWQGMELEAAKMINGVIDKINWLIEKINLIPGVKTPLIPRVVAPAVPAGTGDFQSAQKYALGGTLFGPTYALLAEAGYPETVVPHTRTPRSRALALEAVRGTGLSLGGSSVQITYAPVIQGGNQQEIKEALKEDYDKFEEKMDEYFGNKGRVSYGFD